jgi:hypothetical protein
METIRTVIETLYERTEEYSKTSLELAKLKSLLFVLVLNIGMALWMGELLGKSYYGFFIVAGFYLIAGFIFHFFLHNWIKKPVSKLIITQVLQ